MHAAPRFWSFRFFDFGVGILLLFCHKLIDFVKGHNYIAELRYSRPLLFGCGDRLNGLRENILRKIRIQFSSTIYDPPFVKVAQIER